MTPGGMRRQLFWQQRRWAFCFASSCLISALRVVISLSKTVSGFSVWNRVHDQQQRYRFDFSAGLTVAFFLLLLTRLSPDNIQLLEIFQLILAGIGGGFVLAAETAKRPATAELPVMRTGGHCGGNACGKTCLCQFIDPAVTPKKRSYLTILNFGYSMPFKALPVLLSGFTLRDNPAAEIHRICCVCFYLNRESMGKLTLCLSENGGMRRKLRWKQPWLRARPAVFEPAHRYTSALWSLLLTSRSYCPQCCKIMPFVSKHPIISLVWIRVTDFSHHRTDCQGLFSKVKTIPRSTAIALINKEEAIVVDTVCGTISAVVISLTRSSRRRELKQQPRWSGKTQKPSCYPGFRQRWRLVKPAESLLKAGLNVYLCWRRPPAGPVITHRFPAAKMKSSKG